MRRFLILTALVALTFVATITALVFYQQNASAATSKLSCVDTPAQPDYLSTRKPQDAIAAINHARSLEHLPALNLPSNFYALSAVDQQFVLLNLERTDRGLKALTFDDTLARIAHNYSEQIRDLKFFAHTSPIAGSFSDRINSNTAIAGHYSLAGENLAGNPVAGIGPMYEYLYNDTAEQCGHRDNILDPALRLVGIGVVNGSAYGTISAQEFLTSASWNPFVGTKNALPAPVVGVTGHVDSDHTWHFDTTTQPAANTLRITWFVDHVGQNGVVAPSFSVKAGALSTGKHIVYASAVDGEQHYTIASYTFVV